MTIDATFWVAISFFIFFAGLIYLKVPQKINGSLMLLGKSLPLRLDFTWNKSAVYPFGHRKHTLGVSARGSFQRSAYDMNYAVGNGWVGDNVELIVEFEAYRQE